MAFQHSLFEDYGDRLAALHQQMKEVIAGLPVEALNWVPGKEMNSIAVLVTHTCGAQRFWIETMAGDAESDRVRAKEFAVERATEAELLDLLDDTLAHSRTALEQLTLDALTGAKYGEPWERYFRRGWSLLHALEHTASHVGHMQITRQLWEQNQ